MHKVTPWTLSLVLLVAGGCQRHARPPGVDGEGTIALSGQILRHDGAAASDAHLHWTDPESRERKQLATDADGRFRLDLPVAEELPRFEVSAPFHGQVSVEIPPGMSERFELTVHLAPYRLRSPLEEVKILGDWNDFDFSSAEPMTREDDGRFVYTTTVPESGRVAYQVLGVEADGRSINGTQADAFEYDGGGDYKAILEGEPGAALAIRFDPAALPPAGDRTVAELSSLPPTLGNAFALRNAVAAARRDVREREEAAPAELPDAAEAEAYAAVRRRLEALIRDGATPTALRGYASSLLLGLPEAALNDELIELSLDNLPVDSPLWSRNAGDLPALAEFGHQEFVAKLGERSPIADVRARAIYALAREAKGDGDMTRWHVLAERFRQETGDPEERYEFLWSRIDPQARIQVGHLVPEFSVAHLDGEGEITQDDLEGRYTLLDFWAVWCAPCVAEMPELHAAWERFGGEDFQILSLSFDDERNTVEEFRQEKHPMPWEHAFAEGGFDSEVAEVFEISGIPRPILVGPDGTILAMEYDLRGEDLEPTLERFLPTGT